MMNKEDLDTKSTGKYLAPSPVLRAISNVMAAIMFVLAVISGVQGDFIFMFSGAVLTYFILYFGDIISKGRNLPDE